MGRADADNAAPSSMLDKCWCHCSEPAAVLAGDDGPVLRERAVQALAPQPGTWQAGTQARTGLAACLGFSLTAEQADPSSAPLELQAGQQPVTSAEASEVPVSAAAVSAPHDVKTTEGLDSVTAVRMKRQQFLDSMRQGSHPPQPQSNGSASYRVEARLDKCMSSQHPFCAVKEQEHEEAKGNGIIAADSNSKNNHHGDQPGSAVPNSMQAGAGGSPIQGVAMEHPRAAEQPGSEQRHEQPHGSGSAQQAHQECEICFQPMRFAYVSAPVIKAIQSQMRESASRPSKVFTLSTVDCNLHASPRYIAATAQVCLCVYQCSRARHRE